MQLHVDKLSCELIDRYKLYIRTFLVDIWSERDTIEFRFGYCLRRDSKLQSRIFRISALDALSDDDHRTIIDALFSEIETQIDESIARTLVDVN